jgi:16S rRNA (uracil1498-N3)-methyltransferase
MPRIYQPTALATGQTLNLNAEGARHVQVLRMQPGQALTLFGDPVKGGEWAATITDMGRSHVTVQVGAHATVEREWPVAVHLAVSMPANDRMDWLVEKATELGVASIQPLMSERSVLRLKDERAIKKQAHWQAVAVSACEQCGGNRVPVVHAVQPLEAWLRAPQLPESCKLAVLSLAAGSQPLPNAWGAWAQGWVTQGERPQVALALGPEGGWSPAEEQALFAAGAVPVSLGPRVLRSETAAVAALAMLASLSSSLLPAHRL